MLLRVAFGLTSLWSRSRVTSETGSGWYAAGAQMPRDGEACGGWGGLLKRLLPFCCNINPRPLDTGLNPA